ncbi:MAG: hypothetical protein V9E94_04075 [Microthrixaceae bacterium]
MLHAYDVPVAGRHVVIVGRGLTIGRPLANLLALKGPDTNAAVTVVHTGVDDIGAYTRTADIVVAAAGAPGLITADMVRPGAAVIAAGVSVIDGKVVQRCRRRRGRRGRLVVTAHRRRGRHDPGVPVDEHPRSRRAGRGRAGTAVTVDVDLVELLAHPQHPCAERRVLPAQDRGGRSDSCATRSQEMSTPGPGVRVGHLRGGRVDP